MGLDIQNGALGAEHEQNKNVSVILQNITDSTVYRNWVENITKERVFTKRFPAKFAVWSGAGVWW